MNTPKVTIGLYRHFKGAYYFVQNVVKNAVTGEDMCYYYDVMHPEKGLFVRPVSEWFDEYNTDGVFKIVDRPDNVTGQKHRFEKVSSIDYSISNFTTEHLMRELAQRTDSPLQALDIKGVNDRVFSVDYVIGEKCPATEDHPDGVVTIASFNTEEQAKTYFATHRLRRSAGVFKRTFIELD